MQSRRRRTSTAAWLLQRSICRSRSHHCLSAKLVELDEGLHVNESKRRCLLGTPVIALILGAKLRDVRVPREAPGIVAEPLIALSDVPSRGLSLLSPAAILVHSRCMRDSGNPSRPVCVVLEVDPLVHATLHLSEELEV